MHIGLRDQVGNKFQYVDVPAFEKGQAVSCAYLKFINVPSILDIGGTTPDPTDESLTMSMIDYDTLKEISNFTQDPELDLQQEYTQRKETNHLSQNDESPIHNLQKAIEALHVNQRIIHATVMLNDP